MVGVVDLGLGLQREPVGQGRGAFQAEVAQLGVHAAAQAVQPEMMERRGPGALPDRAERMDEAFTGATPVLERDRELERAGDRTQELLFVDLQEAMERSNGRYGGFAHPHGADLLGLHQGDVQLIPELVGQRATGQPARRPTAGDDNLADASFWRLYCVQSSGSPQRLSRPSNMARMRRACVSSMGASRSRACSGRCSPARSPGPNT
ncbi:hypothetical protein D3C81_975340 [compost metagenome]